jgi:very-short-patch-repair endonuclease
MQASVLARLEASRKELLDLGLRNPLIHYKQPRSKGLQIVQERSNHIFELLVRQGKSMSFLEQPEKSAGGQNLLWEEPSPDSLQLAYTDTRLQTAESESSLQQKLLNTYYAARTSIEEQGINTLFISLGMLAWYESESSEEKRVAPLVLVPVTLERSSARERFRVKYSEEEIGHNLSLQAKLKAEFGIQLPDLPPAEELSLPDYFREVAEAVQPLRRWSVEEDRIELGFFSFGKFMIYHDLNNEVWPEEAKPANHSLLQSLFLVGFTDPQPSAGDDVFIDTETPAHQLFQVVDADSSQLLAMLAVHEGRNMVIQGPPGTGKSQTITNIIANAIGQGKKVLFVAEKMAALEVVKRRLDNIGLGEACLELHSHKANKKELHQELKRVLELGKPSLQKLREEVALLEKAKDELNAYCAAVNTPIAQSGLTAHQLYGYLLALDEATGQTVLPKIGLPAIEGWSAEKQKAAEAMALRIQARLAEIGVPSQLPFWGTGLTVLLPEESENIRAALVEAKGSVSNLQEKTVLAAGALAVAIPSNREGILQLAAWMQLAGDKPDLQGLSLQNGAWLLQRTDIEELLTAGAQLDTLKGAYADRLLPEAWSLDVLPVRQSLKEHGSKWYRFLIGDYKKAVKALKAVSKEALPKDVESRLQYAEDILAAQRLEKTLADEEAFMKELFGNRYQKRGTDWASLKAAAQYLHAIHQGLSTQSLPVALLLYLTRHEDPSIARQHHQSLLAALNEQGKAIQAVTEGLALDESGRFGGSFQYLPLSEQKELLESWEKNLPDLQLSIAWNNLAALAKEEGLQCLADAVVSWPAAKDHLLHSLQKTWYSYLLQKAFAAYPSLRQFERSSHEEVIRQFRRLDLLSLHYNRALAALKHWEELPNPEGGGQVRILKGEFNKKARHKPIRVLMQETGHVIQAIKPVFMMSPLSIANFLTPGAMEFDLVIFDEASQVRPVEALGAMLRGKQLVVVGDTKQLPPTSFFDTLNDTVEDEENVTADMQSILGMCDAQGAPQKMLRWHYRSRHESLITLSNHEFYENKLVVFPSPGSRHSMGLVFHHLADTVYDRGQTRTNAQEAEIVAEAVMTHARKHPRLSLGVVAFSSAQREAIQNALEAKRRATPDLEAFFKASAEEPFFIKNLENVQGDERDVIYISIGYGRTKEGYTSMSFGPLNNDGGERRLNVLITRAKLRCEVFTNITAADIDTSRTQSRGIRALKSFLQFAQTGQLHLPAETGKPFESPFEESVAKALEGLGYTIRQQVGSQGFYLDLAIVDPEHPGRYLLGIECDGAAYHSARSARDRDRLRQQVLEGIGWRIHRIWSTDWFRNPERELKRVVEAIEKAKGAFYLQEDPGDEEVIEKSFVRETARSEDAALPEYEAAILHPEIATKELHQHTLGKLAGWIEKVVQIESPVHFDEMARRMVEAAGISRMGSRIRNQLLLATQFAEGGGKIVRRDEFLWAPQMQKPTLRKRAELPPPSKKIKFIAPEELEMAIEKVVGDAVAVQPEAAVNLVTKLLGFSRVTEDMRQEVMEAIRKAIHGGKIGLEGGLLKLG